jgi:hypothetical protein
MKRFKIIDPSGRIGNTKHDTIIEVIKELDKRRDNVCLDTYYVECLIDDIEINADELISAWLEGERPEDLQMF